MCHSSSDVIFFCLSRQTTPDEQVHDIFIHVVVEQLLNVEVSISYNASMAVTVHLEC